MHEQLLAFFNTAGAVLAVGIMCASTLALLRLAREPKFTEVFVALVSPRFSRVYWAGAIMFVLSDIGRMALPGVYLDPVLFSLKQLFVGLALILTGYLLYSFEPRLRAQIGKKPTPALRRMREKEVFLRVLGLLVWFIALFFGSFA